MRDLVKTRGVFCKSLIDPGKSLTGSGFAVIRSFPTARVVFSMGLKLTVPSPDLRAGIVGKPAGLGRPGPLGVCDGVGVRGEGPFVAVNAPERGAESNPCNWDGQPSRFRFEVPG